MKESIAHRGPDDQGSFVNDYVSLGHRRLSILDLSENGHQPLSNAGETVWITFNGEIYNYPDLRKRLEAKGRVFRSHTDTEAIVHAYEEFGDSFVTHLTGMFAFAIYDMPRKRFVLARDRLGIKPLYYYFERGRLIFGSEAKAILCAPEVERAVDPQSLFHLMGYEFTPAPATLFRKIHKLLPGHTLVLEHGRQPVVSRFWSLEVKEVDTTVDAFLELFSTACKDHMLSDVPVGAFLSGGIDSSSVVHFAASAHGSGMPTFSLGYADRTFSELDYARKVAGHYQTDHHELMVPPVHPDAVRRSIWHLDEPTTDLSNLPFMLICEQAAKHVKVCLSGDGGDEMLMGYDRFRASKAANWLAAIPIPFRQSLYRGVIAMIRDDEQKKGIRNITKRFLQGAVLSRQGEHMRWQYFMDPQRDLTLFRREVLESIDTDPFGPITCWSREAPAERGKREQFVEVNTILPDSVLMKVDKMAMAHSLEVRPPFLDHRVVEHCYSLPTNMKLRGFTTKWVFKRAVERLLPPGIAFRGKQGFSFPIKNWMRGELSEFTHDEIFSSDMIRTYFEPAGLRRLWEEHQAMTHNHSHLLWTLLNIGLWGKMWKVS
jgi:asparagine synthase (glutamine-hydrolysing)